MDSVFYISFLTIFIQALMFAYIVRTKNKKLLHYIFLIYVVEMFVWIVAVMLQSIFGSNPDLYILFENLTYLASAFLPVHFIILGLAYARSDIGFSKKYLFLYIIPILTTVMVWTNNYHHLFFVSYFPFQMGSYFYVHAIYSYMCLVISLIYLSYFAIKNSGLLSIQAVLITIGSILPVAVNILYTLRIENFNAYSTPMAFTVTLGFYFFGMLRFNLLKISPIALQTVINRISDSFIVVDHEMNIIDYNRPFSDNFYFIKRLNKSENLYKLLKEINRTDLNAELFAKNVSKAVKANNTVVISININDAIKKNYYNVEFTPIFQNNRCIAIILLFKNITQHVKDMEKIKENQDMLLERERLASLGQLIGGIAHNLKTPIMSVAGGIDQLAYLSQEYISSIDDPEVTIIDHKEIGKEMLQWLTKMKVHLSYMSDIITTVKDQASKFNNPDKVWFTLDEMLRRVKILMQHEIVKNNCNYKQDIKVKPGMKIDGDMNSLVQILDNVIVNAIQSYEKSGGEITMQVTQEGDKIIFMVRDSGMGIEDKVKDRLFKEMITTKGKYGTGLGLYMSYSTIKGVFGGNMWFETKVGRGTDFFIEIPLNSNKALGVEQDA